MGSLVVRDVVEYSIIWDGHVPINLSSSDTRISLVNIQTQKMYSFEAVKQNQTAIRYVNDSQKLMSKSLKLEEVSIYSQVNNTRVILGRPTYLSADLCFVTDSFFLRSCCFRRLISELAEQNSTKIGHMLGSNCDLKTHVQNLGYPLPVQIEGSKITFLGQLRNLMVTLTAYIFGTKHNIENRSSALTTTRGRLHRRKMS